MFTVCVPFTDLAILCRIGKVTHSWPPPLCAMFLTLYESRTWHIICIVSQPQQWRKFRSHETHAIRICLSSETACYCTIGYAADRVQGGWIGADIYFKGEAHSSCKVGQFRSGERFRGVRRKNLFYRVLGLVRSGALAVTKYICTKTSEYGSGQRRPWQDYYFLTSLSARWIKREWNIKWAIKSGCWYKWIYDGSPLSVDECYFF